MEMRGGNLRLHLGRRLRLVSVFVAMMVCGYSSAQRNSSPIEAAVLPEYCKEVQSNYEYWGKRTNGCNSLHHYCWGLGHLFRATSPRTDRTQKRFHYRQVVMEIDYTVSHSRETCLLLPEMFSKRGQALLMLEDYKGAEESFAEALERKPNYWPAYLGLAKVHMARRDVAAAKRILEQGIEKSADPRALQQMLDGLGTGK